MIEKIKVLIAVTILAASVLLTYGLFLVVSQVKKQFDNNASIVSGMTVDIKQAKVEVLLNQAAQVLQKQIMDNNTSNSAKEVKEISPETEKQLSLLNDIKKLQIKTIAEASSFWVYAGVVKDNKWVSSDFRLDSSAMIKNGDTATLAADTYKRDNYPVLKDNQWLKGRPLGILLKNETIIVKEIKEIDGIDSTKLIWVKAESKI